MRVKSSPHTPTFRLHKATGKGYVVLDGRHFYLGLYDSAESRTRYHQIIAEWIADGLTLSPPRSGLTVVVRLHKFLLQSVTPPGMGRKVIVIA